MTEPTNGNGTKLVYLLRTVWSVIGVMAGIWCVWLTTSIISLQNQGIRGESDRIILMEMRADVKLLMELRPDVKKLTSRFPDLDQEFGTRLTDIWNILHSPNKPITGDK